MLGQDNLGNIPFAISGVAIGVLAFGILMAALLPVLRHKRKASLSKGFVSIMISLALLHSGVIVVYLFSQKRVLACLVGELVGFFVCWTLLAVYCMTGGRRK